MSLAEGMSCGIKMPTVVEGHVPVIGHDEVLRAWRGLELLYDLVSKRGRPPDALLYTHEDAGLKVKVIQAMVHQLKAGTPFREISQSVVAPAIALSQRTLQRRLSQYHLSWPALKQKRIRPTNLSDFGLPPPDCNARLAPASRIIPLNCWRFLGGT